MLSTPTTKTTVRRPARGEAATLDIALVEAAGGGDEAAVVRLAAICGPRLVRYAASRGATEPEAIANQVVFELVDRLDRLAFSAPGQVWSYLFQVARTKIADERRKSVPEPVEHYSLEHLVEAPLGFEEEVVERLSMAKTLDRLTRSQREVLELRFLHDLTIDETARRTGRSRSAVKALQRRALRAVAGAAALVITLLGLTVALGRDNPIRTVPADGPSTTLGPTEQPLSAGELDMFTAVAVAAGPDMTLQIDGSLRLDGRVIDPSIDLDRATAGTWRKLEGPGEVSFTATADRVEATFSEPGSYVLRFSAGTGELQAHDDTVVVVEPVPVHRCGSIEGTVTELESLGYAVIIGSDGDTVIDAAESDQPHFIVTTGGTNTIATGGGDDVICGGPGVDVIDAGPGADRIESFGGDDVVHGGAGNDRIFTGGGDDTVNGNSGNDTIEAGSGDDTLHGNGGNDTIDGEGGHDVLNGGSGSDRLNGGGNNDVLNGGAADDVLRGGGGGDQLRGNDGDDVLIGGWGTDTGDGGAGSDTCDVESATACSPPPVDGDDDAATDSATTTTGGDATTSTTTPTTIAVTPTPAPSTSGSPTSTGQPTTTSTTGGEVPQFGPNEPDGTTEPSRPGD